MFVAIFIGIVGLGMTKVGAVEDVYKRQDHNSFIHLFGQGIEISRHHQDTVGQRGDQIRQYQRKIGIEQSHCNDQSPVSYTHLDVYKRQAPEKHLPAAPAPAPA